MTKGQAVLLLDLPQDPPLAAYFRWDLVHEVDVGRRSGPSAL